MNKKVLSNTIGFFFLVGVLLISAALADANFTWTDRKGNEFEYMTIDGKLTKVQIFKPPPGTRLMSRERNGQMEYYYEKETEENQN